MKHPSLDKQVEELEAIGSDNNAQAVRDTQKIFTEREKESQEKRSMVLESLEKAPKSVTTYYELIARLLSQRMMVVDWPDGWTYVSFPTPRGVVFQMKYQDRMFQSAFTPTGQAKYDLNAIDTYAIRAENTIDRVKNSPRGENV